MTMENSAPNEYRVFGAPGTGKTTYIIDSLRDIFERGEENSILVSSKTKTAARNIWMRTKKMISDDDNIIMEEEFEGKNIGTLHAICYRSLDKKQIAEKKIKDWNDINTNYRIEGIDDDIDGEGITSITNLGAALLCRYNILRHKMIPYNEYPFDVKHFAEKWEKWKDDNDYIDFTDMIIKASIYSDSAPGMPRYGFFDEAQDFTPLELKLARKWGSKMEWYILAGDDDQTIFSFTGASADAFLTPDIPDSQKIILPQSWRLPKTVFDFANSWSHKIELRQEKVFKPQDREGTLTFTDNNCFYKNPKDVMRYVNRFIEAGKSVMILASCSYMLEPIKHELISQCVPFHNPYRTRRGDWNPIRTSNTSTTSANRVLSFLQKSKRHFGNEARMWTKYEVGLWAEIMRVTSGVVKRGASKLINEWIDEKIYTLVTADDLDMIFDSDKMEVDLINDEPDVHWWLNLVKNKTKALEFTISVAEKRGIKKIFDKPQVIIGTIHSVKGGEADSVILFPDLSREGYQEWCAKAHRDSVRRLMYVGMTRCMHDLVICRPSSALAVDFSK